MWHQRSAVALLSLACIGWPAAARAQNVGEKVYKTKCAMCHGPEGGGNTPAGKTTKARDLCSDDVKKETDDEWATIISNGKNKMPAYDKKISADEMKAVLAYMRSMCKK